VITNDVSDYINLTKLSTMTCWNCS